MGAHSARIQTLFGGPIDIVGDVQGELGLLQSLLQNLGYDARTAVHPEGRRLVFVGDLVDRGPDSAGVLERVMGWMAEGQAQCILGNHELDILRGKKRPDENGWFFAEADEARRATWRAFMDALPAALERADLRVVHACWDDVSLEWLAAQLASDGYQTLHQRGEARAKALAHSRGLDRAAEEERAPYATDLKCPDSKVPLLRALGTYNAVLQSGNPVKVLTSGPERPADCPKFIAGAWRMTDQERWWNRYADAVPVVIGHFRRAPAGVESSSRPSEWDYVFDEYAPYAWLGPQRKVFCVDYSGQGYQRPGQPGEIPLRLAALRWPECELVFDDGERVAVPGERPQNRATVERTRPTLWQVSYAAEVDHWFDDSSLSSESGHAAKANTAAGNREKPELVLVHGTPVSGKTRFRHENYSTGFVTVDAGDIFRRLEKGQILDFPGELEPFLDLIGSSVARRAIQERRHVVTEAFGVDPEFLKALLVQMHEIGYETRLDYIKGSVEQAEQWNLARGPDNISSYYTDAYNLKWLMAAAKLTADEPGGTAGNGTTNERISHSGEM